MAPIHWRPTPLVFVARPRPVSDGDHEIATWPHPGEEALKERTLLRQGEVDDGKEGDNGRKGMGGKVDCHNVLAQKCCLRHESLGTGDLDLGDIDASDTKS